MLCRPSPVLHARKLALLGFLPTFLAAMLYTAWISDDAMITFRAVLNFANGYGPNWNIGERVQAFTHPLWFLLLTLVYLVTGDLVHGTTFLSIALTLLTLSLLFSRLSIATRNGIVALTILLLSKSFLEYSTSGLEGPLFGLLVVCIATIVTSPEKSATRVYFLFLFAALLFLNRMDHGILILPVLCIEMWRHYSPQQVLRGALLGSIPLVSWLVFSTIYYGFPFPNTAYAKLLAGVDSQELAVQGAYYFLDSLQRDPLTLVAILLALLLAALRGGSVARSFSVGIGIYLLYVVAIGGSFMTGRYFMAPLLVSTLVIAVIAMRPAPASALVLGAVCLAFVGQSPLIGGNFHNSEVSDHLIADERAFYYPAYSVFSAKSSLSAVSRAAARWRKSARRVVLTGHSIGAFGINHGPDVHIVDKLALSDALLSRLPQGYGDRWRPGHYQRKLPVGYLKSLRRGTNLIEHERTALLYDHIRRIVAGPLWSWERIRSIAFLNFGGTRALVAGYENLGARYVVDDKSRVFSRENVIRRQRRQLGKQEGGR